MIDLFGSPPLLVNGTMLTLEHVMQRLEIIENKVAIIELIENLDKKIHKKITQYGSKVGVTQKNLKEKEPIVNEMIDLDSARIGKLEDIITNLGSAFSSMKNTPKPPTKTATVESIENLDKKVHNHITQFGSRVGVTLKNLKEKEPIVNEKIDLDSARIGKLEDIITNLASVFSSMKNTPKPPTKTAKFIYVPKNKGETSSKGDADLKSICVLPNGLSIIKEPLATNEFLEFLPKGLDIAKKGEIPRDHKCSIYESSAKDGTR